MYSHRHVGKVLKYQDIAKPNGKVSFLHPLTSKNPKLQRIKQPVIIQLFSNSCLFQNGGLKSNQFMEDPNSTQVRSAIPKMYFFSESGEISDSQHGWVELKLCQGHLHSHTGQIERHFLGKYSVTTFYDLNLIQAGSRL
mgnify:FL=1